LFRYLCEYPYIKKIGTFAFPAAEMMASSVARPTE